MNYEKIFRSIIQKQPFSDVLHKANLESFALFTGNTSGGVSFIINYSVNFAKFLEAPLLLNTSR